MDLENIISLLQIPKSDRTEDQISQLSAILSGIKFFASLKKHSNPNFYEICQSILYDFCPNSSYLFHYGDIGIKYYIVLEGRVSMRIPYPEKKTFTEIMVFEKHSSFGDIALDAYKTRGASAYCLTDCHFLSIEKKDYVRLIQKPLTESKYKTVSFLQSIPFFNQMSVILIKKLIYNIKELLFRKGQTVFKEGDEPKFLYIIRTGECSVNKKIRAISPVSIPKQGLRYNTCVVRVLGEGNMAGEEAALNNLPYDYSCVVLTDNTVVYQIASKDFFSRVNSEDLLKFLKKQSEEKNKKLSDWERKRKDLEKALEKQDERPRFSQRAVEDVNRMRIQNCVSESRLKIVEGRSESRGRVKEVTTSNLIGNKRWMRRFSRE